MAKSCLIRWLREIHPVLVAEVNQSLYLARHCRVGGILNLDARHLLSRRLQQSWTYEKYHRDREG